MSKLPISDYYTKGNFSLGELVRADKLNKNYSKATSLTNKFIDALSDAFYFEENDFTIESNTADILIENVLKNTFDSILKRQYNANSYGEFGIEENNKIPYMRSYYNYNSLKGSKNELSINGNSINISSKNLVFDDVAEPSYSQNYGWFSTDYETGEVFLNNFKDIYLNTINGMISEECNKKVLFSKSFEFDEGQNYITTDLQVLNGRGGLHGETSERTIRLKTHTETENVTSKRTDEYTLTLTSNKSITLSHYYNTGSSTVGETKTFDLFNWLNYITYDSKVINNVSIKGETNTSKKFLSFDYSEFEDSEDKTSPVNRNSTQNYEITDFGGVYKNYYINSQKFSSIDYSNNSTGHSINIKVRNDNSPSGYASDKTTRLTIDKIESGSTSREMSELSRMQTQVYEYYDNRYHIRAYRLLGNHCRIHLAQDSFVPIRPKISTNIRSCYYNVNIIFSFYTHSYDKYDKMNDVFEFFNKKIPSGVRIKATGYIERFLMYDETHDSYGNLDKTKLGIDEFKNYETYEGVEHIARRMGHSICAVEYRHFLEPYPDLTILRVYFTVRSVPTSGDIQRCGPINYCTYADIDLSHFNRNVSEDFMRVLNTYEELD